MNSGKLQHRNDPRAVLLFLLAVFVGWLGVDRFVNGNIVLGVLKLLTVGGVGVWWVIDIVIFAVRMVRAYYVSPLAPAPTVSNRGLPTPKSKAPRRRAQRVDVAFREFHEPFPKRPSGYVYAWGLSTQPEVGERVYVRGGDGEAAQAIVLTVDPPLPNGYTQSELAPVLRTASAAELERADARRRRLEAQAEKDEASWLNMARRAAGLPVPGRVRSAPPEGMPEIPPVTGDAGTLVAEEYGRIWWRAYRHAEDAGRPSEEVDAFRRIAKHWYGVARARGTSEGSA